ncbi:MAG: Carboxypeptidase T precursor [Candidatus Cloacimonetes bacterium ADurb.Bin089]|nr:MAG: Carboxypeptidase T precursor [Candidatus Cloacimonetes bacterium ADurb.Bin089]
MKRILFTLCLLTMATAVFAYPLRIQSWNLKEDLKKLNELKVSIDYVNLQTGVIHIEVRNNEERDKIHSAGILTELLPNPAEAYFASLADSAKDDRSYYTLTQYQNFMQLTAAQYPGICQLVQFGTSVDSRPLLMLKISDNVALEETEPELKYISSIHGDEVVGYDMLIRLIQLLTTQYGIDPRITNLVDNTEIWINPMLNPDGYAAGIRYNANGIDLNRNFPMPTGNQHPDGEPWAAETIAVMDFSNAHDFDLAINFHGGSLVINYPWDYTYILTPDNALLIEMALTYSRENSPMFNSTEFVHGITNGAAWYVITGSMQDWNYYYTDCIELTAEIGYDKWPPASNLDAYWADNEESLLKYIEFAQNGVKGIVTNSSGTPIAATITVAGNSKLEHTDLPAGDYHRLLLPGTYQITASAAGYIPQTVNITVPPTGFYSQNFTLQSALLTTFEGQVRTQAGITLSGASVTLNSNPPITVQTDAQGLFSFTVDEGDYQIYLATADNSTGTYPVQIRQNDHRNIFIMQSPIFSDNFESGLGNWTATGTWGIVTYEGSNVLTDSPSGNYSNSQNRSVTINNPLSFAQVVNPGLSFKCKYALEDSYDYVYLEASANGNTWTVLDSYTGTLSTWTPKTYSLANYAGNQLYLRFRIQTDYSQTADGIYIDEVKITGINNNQAVFGDVTSDGIINMRDIAFITEYAIGLDPIPEIDVRPWEAYRITNADVDGNSIIDAFDSYLLCQYISVADYLLPVQSGVPEEVTVPVLTASYSDNLYLNFSNIDELKSLTVSVAPNSINQVNHQGIYNNQPFVQAINNENGAYGFAGYNIDQQSLSITLASNPEDFTLFYTINGVPGSQFVTIGNATDDPFAPEMLTSLLPNSPNPFNPETTLYFTLAKHNTPVSLTIYNLKGQLVRHLVSGVLASGKHSFVWNGLDDAGKEVSSGVYFSCLSTPDYQQTRKMLLAK